MLVNFWMYLLNNHIMPSSFLHLQIKHFIKE
jgi:hypothetical protein